MHYESPRVESARIPNFWTVVLCSQTPLQLRLESLPDQPLRSEPHFSGCWKNTAFWSVLSTPAETHRAAQKEAHSCCMGNNTVINKEYCKNKPCVSCTYGSKPPFAPACEVPHFLFPQRRPVDVSHDAHTNLKC